MRLHESESTVFPIRLSDSIVGDRLLIDSDGGQFELVINYNYNGGGCYRAHVGAVDLAVRCAEECGHMVEFAAHWYQVRFRRNSQQRRRFGGLRRHFRRSCPPHSHHFRQGNLIRFLSSFFIIIFTSIFC